MRFHERVQVSGAAAAGAVVAADLERVRPAGWTDLRRSNGGYEGRLRASAGPISIDFDCRLEVVDEAGALRVRGLGVAPGMGFTVDARVASAGTDAFAIDADVLVSGALAGLGQRRLHEQARRIVRTFAAAVAGG
jgi:carbon monoxide dehydrogenase subunit G